MKRLLIVTPRFPPTDAVDMHRVRMNAPHYREHGWEPIVLGVKPACAERLVDSLLEETLPKDLEVCRVGALPSKITRAFGVTDLALRSFGHLRSAGDGLIQRQRPDLVFFSTTAFLSMPLGVRWRRRFGVPFVLDFQDPWHAGLSAAKAFQRTGTKHRVVRGLHGWMEARTAPVASGLVSVSESYIQALRRAYPDLRKTPAETVPFGFSPRDVMAAERLGRSWRPFDDEDWDPATRPTLVYAGRIAPAMERSLQTLLEVMAAATSQRVRPVDGMRAAFLGTGYQKTGNPPVVAPAAGALGLGKRIREKPDRLSLLDSLKTVLAADVLLILGSDDPSYQPSKLFQYLALRKPIICVAPAAGRLAQFVKGLESVVFVPTEAGDRTLAARTVASHVGSLIADPGSSAYDERKALAEQYSAGALAGRECALFDRAVAFAKSQR